MRGANLLAGFADWAQRDPARMACHHDAGVCSYAELARGVGQVAGWLTARGVVPDQRVGVCTGRNLAGYTGLLGAVWAGVTYVPLNPKLPAVRLARMVQRAGLQALIVDRAGWELLHDTALHPHLPPHVLYLGDMDARAPLGRLVSEGGERLDPTLFLPTPRAVLGEHGAYIMFTSGTTGEPKGIRVTVANLRHYLDFKQRRYAIKPEDRLSQLFELSFDASVFDVFMALNHGASFHTVPENQLMAPAAFIRQQALTVWFGVPSTIAFLHKMRMLRANSFPQLRISIFGGEPMPVTSLRAWQSAAPHSVVDNVYGPTEATVTCFVQRCDEPLPVTPGRNVVAVGCPYEGMYGAVVDEDLNFLSPETRGELALAGPQVTAGYLGDRAQTARRFRTLCHPNYGEMTWYLTGDLGYQDARGVFHHLGRIDNQVKVSGHRVELEEVDAALREAAGCEAAAAVAWPIEHGSARGLVGFVCGAVLPTSEIRTHLIGRLPAHMVPKQILHLEALPYTLNGKVDRRALAATLDKPPATG